MTVCKPLSMSTVYPINIFLSHFNHWFLISKHVVCFLTNWQPGKDYIINIYQRDFGQLF